MDIHKPVLHLHQMLLHRLLGAVEAMVLEVSAPDASELDHELLETRLDGQDAEGKVPWNIWVRERKE